MSPTRTQAALTVRESRRHGDGAPVGGDRLGRAPQLCLDLGQPQQHRDRGRVQLHRLGQHRRRLDRIARVGQLGEREQPIAPLGERAGGGAAPHHLRQPIVLAARAEDDLKHLEVGLRLGLDRQHLFQAASGHRVVAHLVGVEPRRLTEGRRRPRRRLGEPRLARVELRGRAPVAGRLAQPGLRAQRRQERRVGLEGAPEVGVGAAQIAGRLARAAEIPEQHRAREAVGRRLGQSASGQDDPHHVAGARGRPPEGRQRLAGRARLDDTVPERQRLGLLLSAADTLARTCRRLPEGRARVVIVAGVGETLEGRRRLPIAAEPKRQGHPGVQRGRVARRRLERAAQHAQG